MTHAPIRRASRTRLVGAWILVSVLLGGVANALLAWHLHVQIVAANTDASHSQAVHGTSTTAEASHALYDLAERLCDAMSHCFYVHVMAAGHPPASSASADQPRLTPAAAARFQSHDIAVPLHPPNGALAVVG